VKAILIISSIVLSAFTLVSEAKAESAMAQEVNAILKHISKLPLHSALGKSRFTAALVGDSIIGHVDTLDGCRYDISGFKGASSHYWGDTKWMTVQAQVSSSCLPESPLRLYVDVVYTMSTGQVQTANIYARNGKTNHTLAFCGSNATLTSPGKTCE
jgi:hypothetical protein